MDIRKQGVPLPTHQTETPGFEVTRISDPVEVMQASAQEGLESAETFNLYRYARRKLIEHKAEDIVDPEKLNEEFPGMDIPFVKPMSYTLAKDMFERTQRQRERQMIIARGDQGIIQGVANFGAMAVPQMLDPVNVGMSFFGGAGIIKGLAGAAKVGYKLNKVNTAMRMEKAARNLQKLSGFKKKALEMGAGTAGAAFSEFAIIQPSTEADKMDYSLHDAMMNSMIGGLGFPLAMEGLAAGAKGLNKSMQFMSKSIPRMEKALTYVEQTLQSGKKVNTEALVKSTAQGEMPKVQKRVERLQTEVDVLSKIEKPNKKQRKQLEAKQKKLKKATEELEEVTSVRGEEPVNGVRAREEVNSFENDMYGSPDDVETLAKMEKMADEADMMYDKKMKESINELVEDPEIAANPKEAQELKKAVDNVDELNNVYKSIINCVGR
jgi:hypothetical protein